MELCDDNLENILFKRDNIDINFNNNFVSQICDGLEYIHSNNIVHRDIKPKNIFFKNNNQFKIGDFGLSRKLIDGNQQSLIPLEKHYTSNIGSIIYSAPELLVGGIYNEMVDVYSLGIIIYEIFNLFKTEMEKTIEIGKFKEENTNSFKNEKIETWIVNGIGDNFMINAMNKQIPFTKILKDQ